MPKTIVISGGAGFLGSHLCDRFINLGWRVIAIDNLSTGSKNNISHLFGNKNFTFFEHDVCIPLPKEVLEIDIAAVANLASPASPPHYQRLAVETLMVGAIGTKNLLDLAKLKNARFFQASTSEVYGDPEVHPQVESYKGSVNSYGPRSMYDEAKRFAEALIWVYKRDGVNTGIVRIFNTYGPRMDPNDGRVVSNFIVQALNRQSLTVYGDGTQTRSFCFVTDLINGFEKMILSDVEGPINLGNPNEFTMLELANIVNEMIGSNKDIIHLPLPGDDPTQRKPDISKANEAFGWKPEIQLRDGLNETINYFKSVL